MEKCAGVIGAEIIHRICDWRGIVPKPDKILQFFPLYEQFFSIAYGRLDLFA